MSNNNGAVLVARCENFHEPDGPLCTGELRFRWGMSQAACGTCGAWCGVTVAAWTRVENPPAPEGEAEAALVRDVADAIEAAEDHDGGPLDMARAALRVVIRPVPGEGQGATRTGCADCRGDHCTDPGDSCSRECCPRCRDGRGQGATEGEVDAHRAVAERRRRALIEASALLDEGDPVGAQHRIVSNLTGHDARSGAGDEAASGSEET